MIPVYHLRVSKHHFPDSGFTATVSRGIEVCEGDCRRLTFACVASHWAADRATAVREAVAFTRHCRRMGVIEVPS